MNEHDRSVFEEFVRSCRDNQKLTIELFQKVSDSLESQSRILNNIQSDIRSIDDHLQNLENTHRRHRFSSVAVD